MNRDFCEVCDKFVISKGAVRCPSCGGLLRSPNSEDILKHKAVVAREMAQQHFQIEPGLMSILQCTGNSAVESSPTEPIKLLEVNNDTVPVGVIPLHFGPLPRNGIFFPSVIIEITPDEFQRIESSELSLPDGWNSRNAIPKTAGANGDGSR